MHVPRTLRRFVFPCVIALSLSAFMRAEPIHVSQTQGEARGFLWLRSDDGKVLAHGEIIQTGHGLRVSSELIFRFKDGSLDDEIATFTQEGTFKLVRDHHIQKGPYFPTPIDVTVEANGEVTSRSTDKDGRAKVETNHIDLPPDVSNGMLGTLLLNVANAKAPFSVSMVAPMGKGRLVKLDISPEGHAQFTDVGTAQTANVFRIKIDFRGFTGAVAPLIGKEPKDIMVWVEDGTAPALIREIGQLYEGGPVVSVELSGATFAHSATEAPKP